VDIQGRMLKFITHSNWWVFIFAVVLGLINMPIKFALGILFGGLLITVNFHVLYRTIKKSINSNKVIRQGHSVVNVVLFKYYVRFIISGIIIFLLISKHIVNPIGLLLGLSIVVVSIFVATMCEITKLLLKEAV